MPLARALLAIALAVPLALPLAACEGDGDGDAQHTPPETPPADEPCPVEEPDTPPTVDTLRPRADPIEYVGLTVTQPVDAERFHAIVDPLLGDLAATGEGHADHPLQPGLHLTVEADPRTDEQIVIRLDLVSSLDPDDRRTVARVPASLATGELFIDAVDAALAQVARVTADDPLDGEPFWIEYRARTPHGGSLDVRFDYVPGATPTLSLTANSPATSLLDGAINTPALTGAPYETIAGTVWFELGRDEFDFFVERAYGITDSAGQNFRDFQLKPHDWLRLTVTPELPQQRVDVAFEVVTTDGRRLALARAPASYVAGDLFKHGVLRMVDNMLDAEDLAPGSSTRWTVPFHYDDPEGGGVVRVVAQGEGGTFRIAYAVESPILPLRDVDFVPYIQRFDIPSELPVLETDCAEYGSEPAAQGYFTVTFDASSTVRNSRFLEAPLRGDIHGSVYRAEDVVGTGPKDGAEAVADFAFDDVDLTDPASLAAYRIDTQLTAGDYQLLGFIDIDANAEPDSPRPDVGDPVTIPIGDYALECAEQPVRVEFAILRP